MTGNKPINMPNGAVEKETGVLISTLIAETALNPSVGEMLRTITEAVLKNFIQFKELMAAVGLIQGLRGNPSLINQLIGLFNDFTGTDYLNEFLTPEEPEE